MKRISDRCLRRYCVRKHVLESMGMLMQRRGEELVQ